MDRRTLLAASAAGAVLAPAAMFSPTHAQTTTRPVKILVGFPPGGAADIVARRIADRLR